MTLRRLTLMWVGLAVAAPAMAQCEGTWENSRLHEQLDTLTAQVAAFDNEASARTLKGIDRGLPCLEELIDPRALARYARIKGFLAFNDQDEESAVMWGYYAKAVDDNAPWPVELPPGHPYFGLFEMYDAPEDATQSGVLVPPDRGGVFVNGRLITEPTATTEQQNFVQLLDRNAWPKENYWQDGAAFRPNLVTDQGEPPDVPRFYNPDTGIAKRASAPVKVKVEKDPIDIPVVPIALSGGLAVTSGVTYMLAGASQGRLATATTAEDLTKARTSANLMVLISGASAAGALGVGVGGVLLHGNGLSFHTRF